MKTEVLDLIKKDFASCSNRQLVKEALDQKIAFRFYFEGAVIENPVLVRYPGTQRRPRHFPRIDFRRASFLKAIEDYVMDSSREIVLQARRGDALTAIRQIFGEGALELIDIGYFPIDTGMKASNGNARPRQIYVPTVEVTQKADSPASFFHGLRLVKG